MKKSGSGFNDRLEVNTNGDERSKSRKSSQSPTSVEMRKSTEKKDAEKSGARAVDTGEFGSTSQIEE